MVGPNNVRHIVYACFHVAGHFFLLIFHIRPELIRIHKLLAKKLKKQKKNSLTVNPNDMRHIICTHFRIVSHFFCCYFICRTKTRKNILVISQKNQRNKKKRLTVCPNDVRHIVFAHFHIASCFFVVISYLGLKLVINQKKTKETKKGSLCAQMTQDMSFVLIFTLPVIFFLVISYVRPKLERIH